MRRISLTLFGLLLVTLACGVPSMDPAGTQAPDAVATIVAATMQAKPTAGGMPAAPTGTEPALSAIPSIPDNLRVAYTRDGNAWLWTEVTGPTQLTFDGIDQGVHLSDDGAVVVFIRKDELWAVNTDGSGLRVLVSRDFINSLPNGQQYTGKLNRYEFVPDTHSLFLDFYFETDTYPLYVDDLWRVDADNPAPANVLGAGLGGDLYFSSDEQWVAISQPDAIAVMRLDGSDYRVLFTFQFTSTYSEFFLRPPLVWINNSSGVYVVIPNPTPMETPSEPARFYFIPLDGKPALLAEFMATYEIWTNAIIAPDGSRVGYVIPREGKDELHVIDASTADMLLWTSDERMGLLNWSPDSKHFVYRLGESGLYLGGLDGSSIRLEVSPQSFFEWVDDGWFLFDIENDLRLGAAGIPGILIDTSVLNGDFDFVN